MLPRFLNQVSFIPISSPRSVLYLLSRQYIGTSIASLGIALIDSILLVFTRPNRDTTIFAYQLAIYVKAKSICINCIIHINVTNFGPVYQFAKDFICIPSNHRHCDRERVSTNICNTNYRLIY